MIFCRYSRDLLDQEIYRKVFTYYKEGSFFPKTIAWAFRSSSMPQALTFLLSANEWSWSKLLLHSGKGWGGEAGLLTCVMFLKLYSCGEFI